MEPLEALTDRLGRAWGAVQHLKGVCGVRGGACVWGRVCVPPFFLFHNSHTLPFPPHTPTAVKDSEALRAAVDEVQPDRVAFSLRLAQSRPLYEGFKALKDGPAWAALSPAQRRVVDNELRDFELGGVGLDGEAKARFNEIQQELSQLLTAFSNNVLDATKKYSKVSVGGGGGVGVQAAVGEWRESLLREKNVHPLSNTPTHHPHHTTP